MQNQKKTPKVSKTNKKTSEEHSRMPAQPNKKKIAVNKDVKVENEVKTPARKSAILTAENNCDNTELNEEEEDACMKKESEKLCKASGAAKISKRKSQIDRDSVEATVNKTKSGKKSLKKDKRPLRKRKKVDYSLCDSENEIDADEEWDNQSSDSDSVEESKETNNTKEISKWKGKTLWPEERGQQEATVDYQVKTVAFRLLILWMMIVILKLLAKLWSEGHHLLRRQKGRERL